MLRLPSFVLFGLLFAVPAFAASPSVSLSRPKTVDTEVASRPAKPPIQKGKRVPSSREGQPPAEGNPAPEARGKLRLSVTNNGLPATGSFEVFAQGSATAIASGSSGVILEVPAGTLLLKVKLSGAAEVAPLTVSVTVQEGGLAEPSAAFSTGRLSVSIQGNGDTSGIARVYPAGQSTPLGSMGHGGQLTLSAGTYDIKVTHKGVDRWFYGVSLSAGQLRNINAQF